MTIEAEYGENKEVSTVVRESDDNEMFANAKFVWDLVPHK